MGMGLIQPGEGLNKKDGRPREEGILSADDLVNGDATPVFPYLLAKFGSVSHYISQLNKSLSICTWT